MLILSLIIISIMSAKMKIIKKFTLKCQNFLKIISKNNKIMQKNNNLQELNIILPGFYRPKANLHEKKIRNLIEVLGENEYRKDYFDIKGKKEPLHESIIINDYVYFPTSKNIPKDVKLGDLDNIEINEEENIIHSEVKQSILQTPKTLNSQPKIENKQINPEEIALNIFINKIKKQSKLAVPTEQTITITTQYDIKKIIESAKLLDYDVTLILNKLLSFDNIVINDDENKQTFPEEKEIDDNLSDVLNDISKMRNKILNNKNNE